MVTVQQWLFMVGMFIYLPTGFMQVLRGPPTISGFIGRSLSVVCQYDVVYRKNTKYWCKGAAWNPCNIVLRTDGSEKEAKAGRTAIKDNHAHQEFTVTLSDLTESDSDSYWCGIGATGIDLGFRTVITVLPGSHGLRGPPTMTGYLGRSLSVVCKYHGIYREITKYWCKGADWNSCPIVLRTDGSEKEAKAGRIAIKDNHAQQEFTVTLSNLTESDSGSYWCGIELPEADPGFHIGITVLSGPEEVSTAVYSSYIPSEGTTSLISPPSWKMFSLLFLILIGLKAAAFLSLISAIIWMQKKKKMALLTKSYENH